MTSYPDQQLQKQASAHGSDPLLIVSQIEKSFDSKAVLRGLNLTLHRGELIALLGVSGSGKSTLFNLIAGLIRPDSGQIFLNGKDITGQSGQISYMLQKDLLLKHLSILDNVCLPLIIRGFSREEAKAKALPEFDVFGLRGTEALFPRQISGGMAQRAALLRTYLFSNEAALLDEPFSALDALTKSQLHEWFLDVIEKIGLSAILVTHDVDEAIRLCDRILILNPDEGCLSAEIVIRPEHRRQKRLHLDEAFLQYKAQVLKELGFGG